MVKDKITKILGSVTKLNVSNSVHWDSFENWVLARYTWMSDGAARGSELHINGKLIRTKKGLALSKDDRALLDELTEKKMYQNGFRTFIKPDEKGPKRRKILSAPLLAFLWQKFHVDYIIDNTPKKDVRLAMFRSSEEKVYNIQNSMLYKDNVPLDFEAFDQNIKRVFWDGWHAYCSENLEGQYAVTEKLFNDMLGKVEVYDEKGKVVGRWNKGMPSGLYATAFLDSVFNLVASEVVSDVLPEYRALYAQGDDTSALVEKGKVDLPLIAKTFKEWTGFVVNVTKNWYSELATEFLKMIITPTNVYQYPARAVASVLWAYPDFRENHIQQKINTLATVWKELYDRTNCFKDNSLMISDIHAGVLDKLHWTKDLVKTWLHTPSQLGGFGLAPLTFELKFNWKFKQYNDKIEGIAFRRYPITNSEFDAVKVSKISPSAVIDTLQHKRPTFFSVFHTRTPTWRQFIEFTRAQNGLTNELGLDLKARTTGSRVPFKVIGMSDIYVNSKFPAINMRGATRDLQNTSYWYAMQLRHWSNFTPQLWK